MLKLRPYQLDGIKYLRRNKGGCLFWEMRLGKTITVIRYLSQCSAVKRILVVGPYSVLPGWAEAVNDEVIYGDTKQREVYFAENDKAPGWYLINKEAHLHVDFLKYQWDAIILDESFITNPVSQVTRYFLSKAKAPIKILLSGTPAPESEMQYWAQLQFINPRILGYKSFWKFRAERFRPEGYELVMPVRHKIWLAKKLREHCSVLTRKDVNLQKEKIYETRYICLSTKSQKDYSQIENDAMLGDDILKFAGQRWNKMRQLCSGEEKLIELASLMKGELKNKRVIIYAWYVEEVVRIANYFSCPAIYGEVKKEIREEMRQSFQRNDCSVMVIQPETIKFGSCFSSAEAAIFFSRPAGLLTNQQVEERTEDLSTSDSTLIIDLVAKDTIEEDILTSIKLKESHVEALDRMRRAIKMRNA